MVNHHPPPPKKKHKERQRRKIASDHSHGDEQTSRGFLVWYSKNAVLLRCVALSMTVLLLPSCFVSTYFGHQT